VAGRAKNSTKTVATLVDTNILIYRIDPRDPAKRDAATETLRRGEESGELRISHQSLIEFVNAVTRPRSGALPLMVRENATRQVELFMLQFEILYPDAGVVRAALRGMATYGLSWFDAHLWAYAERYGLSEILSEDFQHGRYYGTVRMRNPFLAFGLA
jgi:predicted nucleic acid-binding protein